MRRGFTLIELLVVLFLVAIVVAIVSIIVVNVIYVDSRESVVTTPEFSAKVGTFNGHSYVHFTNYPMTHTVLHDPDCPCRLKAEQE